MMEWRFPEMAFFDHVSVTWAEEELQVDPLGKHELPGFKPPHPASENLTAAAPQK